MRVGRCDFGAEVFFVTADIIAAPFLVGFLRGSPTLDKSTGYAHNILNYRQLKARLWSVPLLCRFASPYGAVVKLPAGASACPYSLSPQQVMVSSVLIPHECEAPADTAVKLPGGGSASP